MFFVLLGFILTIISFTLGVIFTLYLSKEDTLDRLTDRLPKKESPKIGIVERPTAKQLNITKIEEETEEEMAKELRKYYPNDRG